MWLKSNMFNQKFLFQALFVFSKLAFFFNREKPFYVWNFNSYKTFQKRIKRGKRLLTKISVRQFVQPFGQVSFQM